MVKAGFKIFIPVPPNTSLPITTPKTTATDNIHNGVSTGTINGTNIPVTKYPSSTSCPFITAKINSTKRPTPYETITNGNTFTIPIHRLSNVKKLANTSALKELSIAA